MPGRNSIASVDLEVHQQLEPRRASLRPDPVLANKVGHQSTGQAGRDPRPPQLRIAPPHLNLTALGGRLR
eukprot:14839120-Alexandrium_andersonii.AAC.1